MECMFCENKDEILYEAVDGVVSVGSICEQCAQKNGYVVCTNGGHYFKDGTSNGSMCALHED